MNVLVACEYSGVVREAFAKKGHNAWSCDILPTEVPGNHYQDSIMHVLCYPDGFEWDLIIAHPPCTYLSNSGVCWLYNRDKSINKDRWASMELGALFFKTLWNNPCPKICVENPIQHKYARKIIEDKYSQIIQPYQFGHKEQKATCLWLKGLPLLQETDNVKAEMMKLSNAERQRIHFLPPGPERAKLRSRTFQGIANAMAEQWG